MMTQKSLVYVVLAVAVGYLLVSAVPQQVAMFTTPPILSQRGDEEISEMAPESGDILSGADAVPSENNILEAEEVREISFIEMSRLPELIKWWTIDILIALTIYWVAKQRLA